MTIPRRLTPPRVAACLMLAGLLLVGVARPVAAADPLARKRREAAKLRAQLDATDQRLSILAEDYDEARVKLAAAQRRLTTTSAAQDRAAQQFLVARSRARQRALGSYRNPTASIMVTDDLDGVTQRQGYAELARRSDADVLDALRAAHDDLTERSAAAESAATVAAQLEATVKRRQQQAARLISQQEQLLRRAEGDLKVLIEKDRAARAAAEERRAKQEIAAAQRRSAEAARRRADELAAQQASQQQSDRRRSAREAALAGASRNPRSNDPTDPGVSPGVIPDLPSAPGVARVLALAKAQVGKPYVWGAGGPGSFDCSGLTSYVWRAGGVSLPHSSRAQYGATSRVNVSDIRPGDLVFYGSPIHHVGVYVGGGLMVEASHRGAPVRIRSIFRRDLVGVGRVR